MFSFNLWFHSGITFANAYNMASPSSLDDHLEQLFVFFFVAPYILYSLVFFPIGFPWYRKIFLSGWSRSPRLHYSFYPAPCPDDGNIFSSFTVCSGWALVYYFFLFPLPRSALLSSGLFTVSVLYTPFSDMMLVKLRRQAQSSITCDYFLYTDVVILCYMEWIL